MMCPVSWCVLYKGHLGSHKSWVFRKKVTWVKS